MSGTADGVKFEIVSWKSETSTKFEGPHDPTGEGTIPAVAVESGSESAIPTFEFLSFEFV